MIEAKIMRLMKCCLVKKGDTSMKIEKLKVYKAFYGDKIINNYAWKEPNNPGKFVLIENDGDVNTWFGYEIKNLGWDKIPNTKFVEVK